MPQAARRCERRHRFRHPRQGFRHHHPLFELRDASFRALRHKHQRHRHGAALDESAGKRSEAAGHLSQRRLPLGAGGVAAGALARQPDKGRFPRRSVHIVASREDIKQDRPVDGLPVPRHGRARQPRFLGAQAAPYRRHSHVPRRRSGRARPQGYTRA